MYESFYRSMRDTILTRKGLTYGEASNRMVLETEPEVPRAISYGACSDTMPPICQGLRSLEWPHGHYR